MTGYQQLQPTGQCVSAPMQAMRLILPGRRIACQPACRRHSAAWPPGRRASLIERAERNGAVNPQDARQQPGAAAALNFQTPMPTTGQIASNREISNFGDLARQLGIDQLVLVNFLIDHQVSLNGAVSGPGSYFVGPNVPLQDLVQAAGGTTNWADESGVELISTEVDTPIGPFPDAPDPAAAAPGHAGQLYRASARSVAFQPGVHGFRPGLGHGSG